MLDTSGQSLNLFGAHHHPVLGQVGCVPVAGQVDQPGASLVEWNGVVETADEPPGPVGSVAGGLVLPEGVRTGLREVLAVATRHVNQVDVGAARRQVFVFSVALRLQRPYGLLGTGSPGGRWGCEKANVPVQCCFTSTETVRTIRDREPRWTLGLLEGKCSSCVTLRLQKPYGLLGTGSPGGRWGCEEASVRIQCCFTSTETVRTIRDREPRWTLGLLEGKCSYSVLLYVYRNRSDY